MAFGVNAEGDKSAVMVFGVSEEEQMQLAQHSPWSVDGVALPVVSEYRYLGVHLNNKLDFARTARRQAERAERALGGLMPALTNREVPVSVKLQLVRALLMPVCRWGGEIFGMNGSWVRAAHKVLTRALRYCFGVYKGQVNDAALYAEAKIPPLYAAWAAQRARAWVKYRGAPTLVGTVLQSRYAAPRGSDGTWSAKTSTWVKRYLHIDLTQYKPAQARQAYESVLNGTTAMWMKRNEKLGLQQWQAFKLSRSRGDWGCVRWDHISCRGAVLVGQLRTGRFLGAFHMAAAGLLPAVWRGRCPCCLQNKPETMEHFVVECEGWERERREWLLPLWQQVDPDERLDVKGRLAVCLGGACGHVASRTLRALERAARHEQIEPHVLNGGWMYRLAGFLSAVWPQRHETLAPLRVPRAPRPPAAAVVPVVADPDPADDERVELSPVEAAGASPPASQVSSLAALQSSARPSSFAALSCSGARRALPPLGESSLGSSAAHSGPGGPSSGEVRRRSGKGVVLRG
jgi:hypothetical protein